MEQIISVILPIFIILSVGYLSLRLNMLNTTHVQAIIQFIIKVSLPAFLLYALSTRSFDEIWQMPYFLGYLLGSLILFFSAYTLYRRFFKVPRHQAAVIGLGSSMSNTGFIGTAVLTLLIAQAAVPYLAMTLVIENIILLSLMLILIESSDQQDKALSTIILSTLQNLAKNPIILSIILGLICSVYTVQWPVSLELPLKSLASTASPLAIFVIGASLATLTIKDLSKDVLIVCTIKLLIMPIVVTSIIYIMPGSTAKMAYAALILSALPMATAFGIYGQLNGIAEQSVASVMLSTLLSLVSIALIMQFIPSPF
ncbi:AEC family transporter [Acinetobacter radioresistens]|jgi:predicted permease|uniref:AEC family transporter n=1 Tax=Acinetobacter TaxID=469 RepID=UPI0005517FCA|nr:MULTISPECIES: AEC family transporter [Acinetobacter]MCX0328007.1 AEC family transporter [Acinetobacter radioresistens]MCX0335700.1 AEC family transporter [Acinetobacter radioresistens]MCX0349365.1 AEC family transporter [Acinetobacter radioresistens]MDY0842128.1 AEC family transporter [Acinetobacter radioresistens]